MTDNEQRDVPTPAEGLSPTVKDILRLTVLPYIKVWQMSPLGHESKRWLFMQSHRWASEPQDLYGDPFVMRSRFAEAATAALTHFPDAAWVAVMPYPEPLDSEEETEEDTADVD